MAKRFIDTRLFEDEWFHELSKDGKLFFIYYITNCDHAGILHLNKKLVEFQTGINSIDTVTKELGNSLVTVRQGLLFMPKYIKFQYPDFPKSKVKQQVSALDILKSHSIKIDSYLTLSKELPNSYDNDNDNGSIKLGEKFSLKDWFLIAQKEIKWLEQVCITTRVEPDYVQKAVVDFKEHIKGSDLECEEKKSFREWRKHCINWIKTQDIKKYQRTKFMINGAING